MIKIKVSPSCTATYEKCSLDLFSHVEDNEYFSINNTIVHSCCVSFGMVIYAKKEFYSKDRHLPGLNEQSLRGIALFLSEFFNKMYQLKTIEIAIGHEHSNINNLCYLMVIITFRSNFNKTLYPMLFKLNDESPLEINNFPFLALKLKAKNQTVMKQYLKKKNIFRYHSNQSSLNQSLLSNSFFINETTPLKSKYTITDDESFWILNNDFLNKFPLIRKWIIHYAKPKSLRCRKALLLYSKDDYPFYNYFIKDIKECAIFTFTFNQGGHQCENPKAIILKDMETYTLSYEDTWLNLLNGNKAMIQQNDGTTNVWKYNIPCIVITQNHYLLSSLYHNEKFRNCIIFQEISKEDVIDKCEADFSNKLFNDLIEKEDDITDINDSSFPQQNVSTLIKRKRKQSTSEEETNDK